MSLQIKQKEKKNMEASEALLLIAEELARQNKDGLQKGQDFTTLTSKSKRKYRRMAYCVLTVLIEKKIIRYKP